jgi:hypothetical protein
MRLLVLLSLCAAMIGACRTHLLPPASTIASAGRPSDEVDLFVYFLDDPRGHHGVSLLRANGIEVGASVDLGAVTVLVLRRDFDDAVRLLGNDPIMAPLIRRHLEVKREDAEQADGKPAAPK